MSTSARTSSGSPGVKVCTRKCASFTQPGVIPPAVQFSNTGLAADRTTSRAPQKNEERASERRMCIFFHAATHAVLESPLGFYWLQCMSIWAVPVPCTGVGTRKKKETYMHQNGFDFMKTFFLTSPTAFDTARLCRTPPRRQSKPARGFAALRRPWQCYSLERYGARGFPGELSPTTWSVPSSDPSEVA